MANSSKFDKKDIRLPEPPKNLPTLPEYWDRKYKEMCKKLYESLKESDVISALDINQIIQFIDCKILLEKLEIEIHSINAIDGDFKSIYMMYKHQLELYIKLSNTLCLNPASRQALTKVQLKKTCDFKLEDILEALKNGNE